MAQKQKHNPAARLAGQISKKRPVYCKPLKFPYVSGHNQKNNLIFKKRIQFLTVHNTNAQDL